MGGEAYQESVYSKAVISQINLTALYHHLFVLLYKMPKTRSFYKKKKKKNHTLISQKMI